MKKKNKKHYYVITMSECVLCGAEKTSRERVYGKKPKDFHKTHIFEQYACGDHFC